MAKTAARKKLSKKTVSKTAVRRGTGRPAKPASADQAIHQLDADFMQAANAGNAAGLVKAFYSADAVLLPPNRPIVQGRRDIQGFLQGLMEAGLTAIKLETTSVASAGDLAYGRGRYTLSLNPPDGAPIEDRGKYVVVYRRQANGSWRAVADIFNSDQPAG